MRLARWATLGAGALCAAGAYLSAGTDGLVAAVLATVIVVGFFATGLIPLFIARKPESPGGAGMGILLLTYSTRIIVAIVALVLLANAGWVDSRWLGLTVIATALVWTAAHVVHSVRASKREPTINPSSE